jgi:serine/threonine protein kinase
MALTIGKYTIVEKLGSGATSDVYHAIDSRMGREVALKVLKPALVADPQAFQRFQYEAHAAGELFHDHIVTVLDMGEAEGRFFIVMRYVDGLSLDAIIHQQGPLSIDQTIRMAQEIGGALNFAHQQGFLHRDVKPANILRDRKGNYWLSDFGLAKAMMSTGLTSHTGAVLGTPAYIAPEVWLGKSASQATDQYALACVVTECLTGKVLFDGETPPAVMTNHVLKGPVGLDHLSIELPAPMVSTLRRALESDPTRRFETCLDFSNALAASNPSQTRVLPVENQEKETRPIPSARRKVLTIAGTLMLAGFLVFGLVKAIPPTLPKSPLRTNTLVMQTMKVASPQLTHLANSKVTTTVVNNAAATKAPTRAITSTNPPALDAPFADDFSNLLYEGKFSSQLWQFSGDSEFYTVQQKNGEMVFSNTALSNAGGADLLMRRKYAWSQLKSFQARLKLSSQHQGGYSFVKIQIFDWDTPGYVWWTECNLTVEKGKAAPYFYCDMANHYTADDRYEFEYRSPAVPALFDTWYSVRIETDPTSTHLKFYLDNQLAGEYTPKKANDLLKYAGLQPSIGIYNDSADGITTGYVDDVAIYTH